MLNFKNPLEKIHGSQRGKVSDKWSSYLKIYDKIFQSYRSEKIKLLEIGIQNGGSLEVWSKYFEKSTLLLGCDINEKCRSLKYEDEKCQLVIGDATSNVTYESIVKISSYFDIVIDDGSHISIDVINAFLMYFPLVSPGGVFVVEDTHTLFWERFQGGLTKAACAKEFFKKITDVINYEHWEGGELIEAFLLKDHETSLSIDFIIEGWIDSIEFYNSMIVIRKASTPTHGKLGSRVIVGKVAEVEPNSLKVQKSS